MSERAKQHEEMLLDWTQGGLVCVSVYQGYKLGIFHQLGKFTAPKTSQEIADSLQMKERYVREWLSIMVTAKIIESSEDGARYFLPEDLRPVYCSSAAPVRAGFVPIIGETFEKVMDCFRNDGPSGIAYECSKIDHIEDEIADIGYTWDMLKGVIEGVPGLFQQLEAGISVLEIGSGGGIALQRMAPHFSNSTFLGTDISSTAVESANKMTRAAKFENITFQCEDVTKLPNDWDEKFDYVFCLKVIHDVWKPSLALKEIFRVMKNGTHFSMVEVNLHSNVQDNIDNNYAAPTLSISLNYCMSTALATPGAEGVGNGWGKENMKAALEEQGFSDISFHEMEKTILVHVVAMKRV